jgi:TRAP-type C4-dicarboxylate transport system permease small subunit
MMALTRPARRSLTRLVAAAILALAAATIVGAETVTTAVVDAQTPAAQASTLLGGDATHGNETVGVQPAHAPAVSRAASVPAVRSLALTVAAVAAGLACVGAGRRSRRGADDRLSARVPRAWAGPGGRRAPPLVRVA